MRKSHFLLIITVLCVLALFACGLFACKKVPQPDPVSEGRVTPVSTAMNTVYAAMLAADESKTVNYFTLLFDGSYSADGTAYDFDFGGAFDITQKNRDDDSRSELYFEVKQGSSELFLLYYAEGQLYLDFPPYARRAKISDFTLSEAVYQIQNEKNGGVLKEIADTIPAIAASVFSGCVCYTDGGVERYVFTLSYEQLFATISSFVTTWDAGFSPSELLSALHLNEETISSLSKQTEKTTVEFVLQNGVFTSASAETAGKKSLSLAHFSLKSGTAALTLPSALSSFTEFDFRNFALSGTLNLKADNAYGDREGNYGVTVNRDFDAVTYPFAYDFKSHYVAGQGLEFDLALTDPNGKSSRFAIRGEYLYADLSSYGVSKLKVKTADLWEKLGVTGFRDTGEYTFKDALRLVTLLSSARSEEGDLVTYDLGADFFSLLSEKLGFKGLFGVSGATIGWNKANDRLQDLTASLKIGGMSLSLQASSFTFGTPVELPAIDDAAYTDLATRTSTHLSARGTLAAHTSFSSDGEYLSALLSSLSGETVTFEAEGSISYTADFVYNPNGSLRRFLAHLYSARGAEIVTIYFTEETASDFYLIYPEVSGVRALRTLKIQKNPLASFNDALGASESSVGYKVLLSARTNSYTIGVMSPMVSWIGEKLTKIYPELDLSYLEELRCRRFELKITDALLTGKVVFDSDNDLTVTATKFAVTFGDDVTAEGLNATFPQKIALLADNDMPESATVRFTGENGIYIVSLLDYVTGEKIWRYAGAPDHLAKGEEAKETTTTASATLLGKTLTATLTVDITPASATLLAMGDAYAEKFDPNNRAFRFDLYNDVSPAEVLSHFRYLTVSVGAADSFVKEIRWNSEGVKTSNLYDNDQHDFTVKPMVKTYFGDEIYLGSVADFTVHIDGSKATGTATDYKSKLTFVPYERRESAGAAVDPADEAVYPDTLNVTTATGSITVEKVEWNLARIVEIKKDNTVNGEIRLYAYYTKNPDKPDTVKARVYDLTGNFVELDIPVYFERRLVEKASFDTSGLEGVSFDEEKQSFTFDVLKVRALSATATDKVLPNLLSANADTDSAFTMQGLKWEFAAVEGVANASGSSGTLTLVIGDAISGYQRIEFPYAFTTVEITKTALLDQDKNQIGEAKTEDVFRYEWTNLNVYDPASYRFPAFVKVTYGETEEFLAANWSFDTPYLADALWTGEAAYEMSAAIGSETLSLSMTFAKKYITNIRFSEAERSISEQVIGLSEMQGKTCLTFSVLDAINEASALNYAKTSSYPTKAEVTFNGTEYVETDVTWDLSAFADKSDMIGIGGIVKVTAIAKGQRIDVYVYVKPAVGDGDSVYVDEARSKQLLSFRLMTASEGGFKVTDPRDASAYPDTLYVTSASSALYEVKVVEWLDVDKVVRLYNEQMAAGASPNEVKGAVTVKAKIGDDAVGYKEIPIEVAIVESTISEITVAGLPFAASSEQTGGGDPYAIRPTYEAGETASFSYKLSLELNPYYVNPTEPASYPAYVAFDLGGIAVKATAKWDLTRIPANAATSDETATYLVYAMIDLTDAFPNVLVPVAVKVLKREIDKVWIEGSSQPYIDVDGYAAEPFGSDVEGDEVTRDVRVQFKGDAGKYPLKLKYSKAGVVLSYDGSGLYENITVRVGNESGGYQAVSGYSIRVISNIVSRIELFDGDQLLGTDGVFFRAYYESESSDKLLFKYTKVLDMSKALPDRIKVTFGMGGVEQNVYRVGTAGASAGGVVFDWGRSEDGYIGVILWNPGVSEATGGDRQAIYNPEQDDYNEPYAAMLFETAEVWSEVYRDIADVDGEGNSLGYITAATSLALYAPKIKTDKVGESYQDRFVTEDADDAVRIGAETRLDAGTYRLYVNIVGHNHYKGKVYKTFTIEKKDITSSVHMFVNGGLRASGDSADYTGRAYLVTASAGSVTGGNFTSYPITVPLLLEGEAACEITNVRYETVDAVYQEAYYEFVVTVAPSAVNYTVAPGTILRFKLLDIPYEDMEESVLVSVRWNGVDFTVGVAVDDVDVYYDASLTNGYVIKYYESDTAQEELTSFTAGQKYFYRMQVKVPNHTICYPDGWVTAK